jgi:hypothetical protein
MRRRQEAPNLNATTPAPKRATMSRPVRRACLRQRARRAVGVVDRTLAASSTVSTDEGAGLGEEDWAVGEGRGCSAGAGRAQSSGPPPTAGTGSVKRGGGRLWLIGPRGRLGAWGSR